MAERMARSHREIPPASCTREVDLTTLLDLLATVRSKSATTAPITPFVALTRVIATTLVDHPAVRTPFGAGPAGPGVDLAVAVDTTHGLAAPVVRDADALGLDDLAEALRSLAEAAEARRLSPAQVTGATFAVTNHGRFGTDDGVPIVPPGQAAVLAVGAIRPRPFVVDDVVEARPTVFLTLVFDHRGLDGAAAARLLGDIADRLGDPATLDALLR